MDLDGDCDNTDITLHSNDYATVPATGYDRLSRNDSTTNVENRTGYAGYQWDPIIKVYHVRHRVLDPHSSGWTRRDPLGYVDGMSMYEYGRSSPLSGTDPSGLGWDASPPIFGEERPCSPDPMICCRGRERGCGAPCTTPGAYCTVFAYTSCTIGPPITWTFAGRGCYAPVRSAMQTWFHLEVSHNPCGLAPPILAGVPCGANCSCDTSGGAVIFT